MSGILYLCATPIGNLQDMTFRVLDTLKEADLIAAEDTRNSIKLLNHFEYSTQKYYSGNYRSGDCPDDRIPDKVRFFYRQIAQIKSLFSGLFKHTDNMPFRQAFIQNISIKSRTPEQSAADYILCE